MATTKSSTKKAVKNLALSDQGAAFIGQFEGYRRYPYNDAAGHATIGYGHLIHYGGVTARDRLRYAAGLSQRQALALLKQDAGQAAAAVKQTIKVKLTQQQFDALVSFTFNVGGGALHESTLAKKVNSNASAPQITAAFEMWDRAGGQVLAGLARRRQAEARLFNAGRYS